MKYVDTTAELESSYPEWIAPRVSGGAANIQDIHPLAPIQDGMLFDLLLEKHAADPYVVPILLSLSSRDLLPRLVQALQSVIDRHDILRTAIFWEQSKRPLAVVLKNAPLQLEDLLLDPERELEEQIRERMQPGHLRLDLHRPPLLRLQVVSDERAPECLIFFQIHHIIADHESWKAVIDEARCLLAGTAEELARPAPFREYVARAIAEAETEQAERFARAKFSDVTESTAPFGVLKAAEPGEMISESSRALEKALAERIRAVARRAKATPATLFHAAWALVVAHTTGSDDVVFGTVIRTAQPRRGDSQCVGMFINTLPLRLRLSELTASDLIEDTRAALRELVAHKHIPLALWKRTSSVPAGVALFTSLFNYRHSEYASDSDGDAAQFIRVRAKGEAWTTYPIDVNVDDLGDGFSLLVRAHPQIDASRVSSYFHEAVLTLTEALEHAPQIPALGLSVLPAAERFELLQSFNDTKVPYASEALVHELIEGQATRTPDATALVFEDTELTYAELNARSNQLARHLRTLGVGPDQRVAICLQRSVEMVVGLLGTLKAGGAYVPIDPNYPEDRVAYMLRDATPKVLLTQAHLRRRLPRTLDEVIALDADWDTIAEQDATNVDLRATGLTSRHLAYVIYTSGSTGQPKGAMNEHRSVVNRLQWMQSTYGLNATGRVLQKTPFSFDVSVWEFFWTLMTGAQLVVARPQGHQDPEYLRRVIEERGVTTLHFVPSMLQIFLDGHRPGRCASLRHVVCSGEELPGTLQQKFFECFPRAQLSNLYGPTEAAVDVTVWECRPENGAARVPIGRPIANTQMYVLGKRGEPAPLGVAGEIHIGGVPVGRGYLNRPELTAEKFVKDPFSTDPAARLYKTGDVGRWRADGAIEYLGRNDHQVKIRGLRIELGEIESQLAKRAGVKEAVVLAREDVPGGKRLVAYIVGDDPSRGLTMEDLRRRLNDALPEYMVPSAFVVLEQMPLTPNGKLDRKALPAPLASACITGEYEPPQGAIEETLAQIWQSLLRVERVGRNEDVFDLGAHSLLVMQVASRATTLLSMEVPIRWLFETRTIGGLSGRLQERMQSDDPRGSEESELLDLLESLPESRVDELLKELSTEGKR